MLFKANGDYIQRKLLYCDPPPNVTGSLHMGHAFQQTIMDTMIRYQRMQGKNTLLWQRVLTMQVSQHRWLLSVRLLLKKVKPP